MASRRTLETSVLKPQWSMKWFSSSVFSPNQTNIFEEISYLSVFFLLKSTSMLEGSQLGQFDFFSLATLYLEYVTESLRKKSKCFFFNINDLLLFGMDD